MIPIGDEDGRARFPLAVWALIAFNIYVFFQEASAPNPEAFINSFALVPYDLARDIALSPPAPPSPLFTLLTSQFLHDGMLHIASNMLFLFVFGPEVERLTGTLRFTAFYLLCGILAALAQFSVAPLSHVPSIGASGAVAGVLGAYVLKFPTNHVRTIVPIGCLPIVVSIPAILVIGLWALTQFMHGFGAISPHVLSAQGGRIAYFAHIGGFLAGVFLIGFFSTRTFKGSRRSRCG
jgi:membrane associated rhomboid family serine protease